jgi:type VI secretion system protein ImpL
MKKLQLDLVSILVLALLIAGAISIWGERLGIPTQEAKSTWLSGIALGALVLAIGASLSRWARWAKASQAVRGHLRLGASNLVGTTQGALGGLGSSATQPITLSSLRETWPKRVGACLRRGNRLPWVLLTGADDTIEKLLPDLANRQWLMTDDAVLLWQKGGQDGSPDHAWLTELRKLRPGRPVDAVLLVIDDNTNLDPSRRGNPIGMVRLVRIAEALRWAAPTYVLDVSAANHDSDSDTSVIGCALPSRADAAAIEGRLRDLRDRLARHGTARLMEGGSATRLAQLSQRLDARIKPLAAWSAALAGTHSHRITPAGILFSSHSPANRSPLWQHIADSARRHPGRRVGFHPVTVFSTIALGAIGLWTAGMLLSGFQNARNIHATQWAIDANASELSPAGRLRSLVALQHQIERYEPRPGHHAPLTTRFGLNRDAALLAAMWKPYAAASRELLVSPIQQDLEDVLVDLSQMPVDGLDAQASQWALDGHHTLKTYLMLANPERAEPDFLGPQLVRHWQTEARITPGERDDLAERLLTFHAARVKAHPDWRIEASPELVAGARRTVLAVIGQRNAQDTIYRQVIDGIGNKYADQTLVSLTPGTDARGLVRANALVPGAYTRQAYEGHVAEAIARAAKRTEVASDWVLSDGNAQQSDSPNDLQATLTAQYFADYAEQWQRFMNSLQWEPAPTLPAAIDQLKLMADARQSPVIALMKSLDYQGGAGARKDSLSDTLVAKAQDMLGKKAASAGIVKPDTAGPLGSTFGPIQRLMAVGEGAGGDMSLQRFLDRATALRLRLQQVSHSPDADAQARQMAQALFQGKGSELADTQAYAQLIAASLGAEWAGMGEALFVRPIAQATQTVLQPAQASLNAAWRDSIAMAWGRAFAGRYPFADTANDASLPELARFLRPQGGLIHGFLTAQLAGVLELQGDAWQPAASGGHALAFDPAFLAAINRLQRIGTRLLTQGEPRYQFEMKPIPTPGLTDTLLTLDGQTLHYYNQREHWQAMTWPASNLENPGTRLQWQAETAGTNKHYEFTGRWGLVRMLERASIEPIDSATFQLTWQGQPDSPVVAAAPDPDSLTARPAMQPPAKDVTYPIRYQLRTELGHGPLELLSLRDFVLPSRIFLDKPQPSTTKGNDV